MVRLPIYFTLHFRVTWSFLQCSFLGDEAAVHVVRVHEFGGPKIDVSSKLSKANGFGAETFWQSKHLRLHGGKLRIGPGSVLERFILMQECACRFFHNQKARDDKNQYLTAIALATWLQFFKGMDVQ